MAALSAIYVLSCCCSMPGRQTAGDTYYCPLLSWRSISTDQPHAHKFDGFAAFVDRKISHGIAASYTLRLLIRSTKERPSLSYSIWFQTSLDDCIGEAWVLRRHICIPFGRHQRSVYVMHREYSVERLMEGYWHLEELEWTWAYVFLRWRLRRNKTCLPTHIYRFGNYVGLNRGRGWKRQLRPTLLHESGRMAYYKLKVCRIKETRADISNR